MKESKKATSQDREGDSTNGKNDRLQRYRQINSFCFGICDEICYTMGESKRAKSIDSLSIGINRALPKLETSLVICPPPDVTHGFKPQSFYGRRFESNMAAPIIDRDNHTENVQTNDNGTLAEHRIGISCSLIDVISG